MGRRRVERKTIVCKCGCGESRIIHPNELTAKFINRKHYGKWLSDNNPFWGGGKKVVDDEGEAPEKVKKHYITIPTGEFPYFL